MYIYIMKVIFDWKCLDTKLPNLEERVIINTPHSKKNVAFIGYLDHIETCPVVGDKIYTNATIEQVRGFGFNNDSAPVELECHVFFGYDFNHSSLTKSAYYQLHVIATELERYYWDYFYKTWIMPDIVDYQSVKSMFYD